MAEGNLVRLGGISGLLAVVTMIPAYLVGYPDAPGTPGLAQSYFGAGSGTFVFSNGVLPLFHVFFILFLGVLYGMLRGAGGEARGIGAGLPAAALAGESSSRRSRRQGSRRKFSIRLSCNGSGTYNRTPPSCSCR